MRGLKRNISIVWMLSFALLIYLHPFTKQNRGIEQLSIALDFAELEKHVLHNDIQHVYSKPIRCVQKNSRDFTERIFPSFSFLSNLICFCSIYNYCYFLCGYIHFVSRHTFEEFISWCLLALVSNSSPFPLPWPTFPFHTVLSTRLQKKSQDEKKSINMPSKIIERKFLWLQPV